MKRLGLLFYRVYKKVGMKEINLGRYKKIPGRRRAGGGVVKLSRVMSISFFLNYSLIGDGTSGCISVRLRVRDMDPDPRPCLALYSYPINTLVQCWNKDLVCESSFFFKKINAHKNQLIKKDIYNFYSSNWPSKHVFSLNSIINPCFKIEL